MFVLIPPDFNPADASARAADPTFPVSRKSKFCILGALKLRILSDELGEQILQHQSNSQFGRVDGSAHRQAGHVIAL